MASCERQGDFTSKEGSSKVPCREEKHSQHPSPAIETGGDAKSAQESAAVAQCCEQDGACYCNDDCLFEYAATLCSNSCGASGIASNADNKKQGISEDDLESIHEHEEEDEDLSAVCGGEDSHDHSDHDDHDGHDHHDHHDHDHDHNDSHDHAHDHGHGHESNDCTNLEQSSTGLSRECQTRNERQHGSADGKFSLASTEWKEKKCSNSEKCQSDLNTKKDCCTSNCKEQSVQSCVDEGDVKKCCQMTINVVDCGSDLSDDENYGGPSEGKTANDKTNHCEDHCRRRKKLSMSASIRESIKSASTFVHKIPLNIKHHHHRMRYRRKAFIPDPCVKHVNEATLLLHKNAGSKVCLCQLKSELLSTIRAPSEEVLSSSCCNLRKKREIVQKVCCTRIHGAPKQSVTGNGEDESVRLVLSVTGMTCSGCGAKLEKTLRGINGVIPESIRVSFLLSRAECRYNPHLAPGGGAEISTLVHQRTGFSSSVLVEGSDNGDLGARLCLHATEEGIGKLKDSNVDGIGSIVLCHDKELRKLTGIKRGGKNFFLVDYDPLVIGARTILELSDGEIGGQLPGDVSEQVLARKAARKHLRNSALRTLFAFILTIPVAVLAYARLENVEDIVKGGIALPLATLVQISAYPLYVNAVRTAVYQREIDMDVLVTISTTTAFVFSIVTFAFIAKEHLTGMPSPLGGQDTLFETSSMLITLIFLGRLVTAWVRDRASRSSHSMEGLQVSSATILTKDSPVNLDARLLHYNDVLIANPGEKLATDGVVIEGSGELDESLITGEARPVLRKEKSRVLAGSTVVNGTFRYRATRLVHENTIASVKRLVNIAATSRNRAQDLADKVASYLTPIVLVLACIIFLVWTLVSVYVYGYERTRACIHAVTFAIATLAISCPCAIGLAIPMVLVVGTSVGLKNGLVFKSAITVDKCKNIKHAVFDKTGTITNGKLEVQKVSYYFNGEAERKEILKFIWCLTSKDRHPVSIAVTSFVLRELENCRVSEKDNFPIRQFVGNGLEGTLSDGTILRGGKPSWIGVDFSDDAFREYASTNQTLFAVARGHAVLAMFALTDTIRPEAQNILNTLRNRGIKTHMLSGDNVSSVEKVASELGFTEDSVRGGCLPEDKVRYIQALDKDTVLFVGDGNNDALALGEAAVGMSMTHSADLASSSADVEILNDNLTGLITFIDLASRMRRMIWFNLGWSVVYNIAAILLAAGAFEALNVRIEPDWAGAGEVISILPVIAGGFAVQVGFGKIVGRLSNS